MLFFKPWGQNKSDNEANHTLKPFWLKDVVTQDEVIMHRRRQLRLLSVYGIGGCAVIELNSIQMNLWLDFTTGKSNDYDGINRLLAEAIPKAYRAVILDGKDCTKYFSGEHNTRIRETKTTESQIQLCLAREGELLDMLDRAKTGRLLMTNTRLLKSKIGKSLDRIGLIGSKDGRVEHAFLDFVPSAKIGDAVIIHRNIVCEIL
jgi:hypothetical protein